MPGRIMEIGTIVGLNGAAVAFISNAGALAFNSTHHRNRGTPLFSFFSGSAGLDAAAFASFCLAMLLGDMRGVGFVKVDLGVTAALGVEAGDLAGASTFFMMLRESTFSPLLRSRLRPSLRLPFSSSTLLYRSSSSTSTTTPRSSSRCRFVVTDAFISFSIVAAALRSSL